ncbi:unnamed protein product [Rotaria socialis]|nr:unnamed protein product [Rotaria socialis]CAF3344958.1 unnamed protein product [Rotaria socialis]CAF3645023.1 unnamed protein product [Rotaria socialis]CAF3696679.1 unnamed protein product [Rotaria socialis]
MIVLALISVYLQRKDIDNLNNDSAQFTTHLTLLNGSLPLGRLSDENCQTIQTVVSISSKDITPKLVFYVNSFVNELNPARLQGNQIDIVGILPGEGRCRFGSCLIDRARAFVALLLVYGQFIINLVLADGKRVNIAATFSSGSVAGQTNNPDIIFYGLNNQNQLLRFNAQTPSSATSTVTITGPHLLKRDTFSNDIQLLNDLSS